MAENLGEPERLNFDQDAGLRRSLRSTYLRLRNLTSERKEELMRSDSEKFRVVFDKVEKLHEQVMHPREQVADAKALLDLVDTLVAAITSHSHGGITPSDFIICLAEKFGQIENPLLAKKENAYALNWKEIGLFVSPIFKRPRGVCTMNGPMNTEMKRRKVPVHNRQSNHETTKRPDQINDTEAEKTDTDKNMSTMFDILRDKRRVSLDGLILNRKSFAQTVENLFALSFLVRDGRVEINVDANGSHFVTPRNAPAARDVASGKAAYNHFVFRFDYKDWKLMMDAVGAGEELMPHRNQTNSKPASREEPPAHGSQTAFSTALVRKLSRNCGLVVVEEKSSAKTSPKKDGGARDTINRRCKRKLVF